MDYVILEEAGIVELDYEGPDLDLVAFGVLQLQLQALIDEVAEYTLESTDVFFLHSRQGERWNRGTKLVRPSDRLVRAQIRRLSSGSVHQELGFAVLTVLADPDVRGALQGLAGNVLYAFLRARVKGLRGLLRRGENQDEVKDPPYPQGIDVGPRVRDIIRALAANADGRGAYLRLRHKRDKEVLDVELRIPKERVP